MIVPCRRTSGGAQVHSQRAKRVLMRGVGAGRSAQRGTSAATTGPRGAAGPHNPDNALASPNAAMIGRKCDTTGDPDMRATSVIFGVLVLALLLVPLGLALWLDARWFGAQGLE